MVPEKLPKPSRHASENDPKTEAEWEEYFECRKKYDKNFSAELREKIFSTLLKMSYNDKRFLEIGRLQPLGADYVYKVKHTLGLKAVQKFNLYDAKQKYPDEF